MFKPLVLVTLCVGSVSGFIAPAVLRPGTSIVPAANAQRGAMVARGLFGLFENVGTKQSTSEELQTLIIDGLRSGKELAGEDKARADELIDK